MELLDERDEWLEFSRPIKGTGARWESSVVFEGMHCAACAVTIEQALRSTAGVIEAEVNAASHHGRVVWDEGATKPSAWMRAVLRTGYRPLPAHDALDSARRRKEMRAMIGRLGVAGLCMMQVMMYASPSYFAAPGAIDASSAHLLRWAQWILSIPVLLFSCYPFFRNALRDLRLRQVSMDLPVALGMLITFVVSTLGTFEPKGVFGHEVYFDSLTMFVFFLLAGRWLELRLRERTAGALDALMRRLPESVERRTDAGGWQRVSIRRVRTGDVIRVLPGEAFPADGEILEGATLVDEALLTGESTPLLHEAGQTVIAGSHNLTAPVVVRVDQVGAQTRYGQIVALMEQASTSKPHIAQLADRLAKPFLIFVLLAAGLSCAWWWPADPGRALMIAVAILVVTCPCALSLATPAAMLASAGALARDGILVRRLQALETLAGVKEIVFDKTGTLTRDAFVLERVEVRGDVPREMALRLAAALAQGSLHPVSRAIAAGAGEEGAAEPLRVTDLREVAGMGVVAQIDDGQSTREFRLGSAEFCAIPAVVAEGPASHLCDPQGWLASFYLREDVRVDAQPTVRALIADGLRVRLLSGDRSDAAARVGRLAGIEEARGGCSPAEKLDAMRQAQQAGATLAMVGDGLNDGPVLAGADVSFAFGRAVPLARAQADFVVLSERLTAIVQTYRKTRDTMRIVRQNLAWAAIYNAIGVPLAIVGWMPAWAAGLGMAVSSLLVVLNSLRLASGQDSGVEEG
ncbi:MAG: cadmium-translocating P-type ATPase [Burkholderiaceae bacterium]|nr:cadmium-translocating P-type ATPase [Burkholderiaceae bacterium]